jgi:hypothetical protein
MLVLGQVGLMGLVVWERQTCMGIMEMVLPPAAAQLQLHGATPASTVTP